MTNSVTTKVASSLRLIYALFGLLVTAMLLVSCGGGAGTVGIPTGKSLYTTASGTVSIALGSTVSYEIGGGTATYKASSSNASVASVEVKGTALSIKGLLNGTAQIIVSDATGTQVGFNVTVGSGNTSVDLFVTAPSNLSLAPGFSNSYVIGGGKPAYFVSSSNTAIAAVGINGNSFFISGLKAGTAQIIIVDSVGTAVTLNVTVGNGGTLAPLYVTAAGTINSSIGELNDYVVGGGLGPYLVTSNNKSVATVSLNGNAISVKGVAKGSAQIMVFDATGASVTTTVVVDPTGTVIPLYIAAASAVTMEPGAKASYTVGGGSAPYAATSSNINVARAEVANNLLTINAVSAGSAQILVFDANGVSATITLTVGSGGGSTTALYTTAGTAIAMPVATSNTYTIGGGKAPYKATSSNSAVVTVPSSITGTEFTISSVAVGTAQVTIFDATGASVSFSVTVGSGEDGISLFTTAGTGVVTLRASSNTYTIGGGKAPYRATSSNSAVVTVPSAVTGTEFTISSVAVGSSLVTIFDATGASVSFSVTVSSGDSSSPLYTTAGNSLTLAAGVADTHLIGGGVAPYRSTSSNPSVATTTVIGGTTLYISPNVAGNAVVTVFDNTGGSVTIGVTVTSASFGPIDVQPSGASGNVGSSLNFLVLGGKPPYSIISNNSSIATVTPSSVSASGGSFIANLQSSGDTSIVITDALGQVKSIALTVNPVSSSLITVQPDGAGGNVGDALTFLIRSGTPPYTLTVNNPSIASVVPSSVPSSGGSFTATLLNVGSTIVTITDASGQSKAFTLTASQINTILRLSPSPFLLGEDSTDTINLNIFGGTAPYRAFTSDQRLSSVSVAGSVLSVGLGSNGNRCFTPFDPDGKRVPFGTFDVTITVLDSLGAAATSTMTLKDNGRGDGVTLPLCN
ncbi:beta strand repeat-containing protein [Undibacterium danionis]|uniref:Beta strand repeat-containing protein n=1 Tax=Undibacterium danionis TaxID=1812100 RepID=A0ABV6IFF8_9BURK